MKNLLKIVIVAVAMGVCGTAAADSRVLDSVAQQDVKIGGYWRNEFRKLSMEWLPHCIRMMEKGGRGEELLNVIAAGEVLRWRQAGRRGIWTR